MVVICKIYVVIIFDGPAPKWHVKMKQILIGQFKSFLSKLAESQRLPPPHSRQLTIPFPFHLACSIFKFNPVDLKGSSRITQQAETAVQALGNEAQTVGGMG